MELNDIGTMIPCRKRRAYPSRSAYFICCWDLIERFEKMDWKKKSSNPLNFEFKILRMPMNDKSERYSQRASIISRVPVMFWLLKTIPLICRATRTLQIFFFTYLLFKQYQLRSQRCGRILGSACTWMISFRLNTHWRRRLRAFYTAATRNIDQL